MRASGKLLAAALLVSVLPAVSRAATFQLVVKDPAGQGFNDPTPVAPVAGNPGTTLGQQRLNAFQAAANTWGAKLQSSVTIRVEVEMTALDCDASSAVLGQAGPDSVFRDFPGAPRASTWYAPALASSLAGTDVDPTGSDIGAKFNSTLDSGTCLGGTRWWYGIGSPAVGDTIDFYSTILHELGHGVGFLTFVDEQTGAKFNGYDDAFMLNLEDHTLGMTWPAMSNAQRAASAVNTGGLHWVGSNVKSRAPGLFSAGVNAQGHVRMYAPGTLESGSSVSHWDTVLTPNELMEPHANADMKDLITTFALKDMGWMLSTGGPPQTCVQDAYTACLIGARYKVTSQWKNQYAGGRVSTLKVTRLTDATAAFWLNDSNTYEYLIRVNTATDNGRAWIAIPTFTDVEFWITVEDVVNGQSKTYHSDPGNRTLIYDPLFFVYP